jgi:uncharacterized RDD family membrane protein YckC/uncharacterized membrane protein SpoIIM required for sporulation
MSALAHSVGNSIEPVNTAEKRLHDLAEPRANSEKRVSERHIQLWTPERVQLTFPLAGLGERGFAYVVDFSLWLLLALAAGFIYNFWGDLEQDISSLSVFGLFALLLALVSLALLYDVLFETLGQGRTLGKRFMKIRVVTPDGRPPDLFRSLLRNMFRLLDFLPAGYGVGILTVFWTKSRRLGDLVADTLVVSERAREIDLDFLHRDEILSTSATQVRLLTDSEALFLISVLDRTRDLPPAYAERIAAQAATELSLEDMDAETYSATDRIQVYLNALAEKPQSVVYVMKELEGAATNLNRALLELKTHTQLKRRPGSNSQVSIDHINRWDLAIRRASSILMRSTQKRVPEVYLERLSLSLLDAQRLRQFREPILQRLRQFWVTDIPAAVYAERRLIATAGVILTLAASTGFALAFANGEMGRALVGDSLATQIEKGAVWTNSIEEQGMFAQAAVEIIFNNIRVGFVAFVFGLLGGVGTLFVLVANGLHLGSVFGYASRLDSAEHLGRFVLAHGPVELSAICVAAAAGFCLGRAILNPGYQTRMQAIRKQGAIGFRLVLAATVGFLFIGGVEGFMSPGKYFPWQLNAMAGIAAWSLFFFWVKTRGAPGAGARHRPRSVDSKGGPPFSVENTTASRAMVIETEKGQ